ncbi:MAG: single-stranded DNA-binding protein [Rubritalea sp.]|uniref:single-stranded DNA-binding protein n=1 Tax=Rubritalea sp. TaxID=2109375 RepID=UPI003242D177
MSSFNKVMIMGNITRDIELRYTPKGTAVTDLGVACNRRIKQAEEWVDETTFVDVTVWGSSAEFVSKYFSKGKSIFIEGRLQMDTWTDQQSGKQRYKLKVIGENVQFAGSNNGGAGQQQQQARPQQSTPQPPQQRPPQQQYQAPQQQGASPAAPGADFDDDDDIPF